MYSCAFSVNNDLRLAERRSVFDVDELCRLAAQSVGRSLEDICSFVKLSEECHRTFLITMHDGFKMVASVPIAAEVLKYHIIASEAVPPFLWVTCSRGLQLLSFFKQCCKDGVYLHGVHERYQAL